MQKLSRRSALKRTAAAVGVPFVLGSASTQVEAGPLIVPWFKRIHTDLYNFHLRVPWWLPPNYVNDLTIVLYGWFPNGAADIITPYTSAVWGLPTITESPNRYWRPFGWPVYRWYPGWGWQSLWIRYGSDTVFVAPGAWLHFGIHLRPCRFHTHIEAWWTHNGSPVARAWLWHIYKIRFPGWWLYQFRNPRVFCPVTLPFPDHPTDAPRFLYNARCFVPAADNLPRLEHLLPDIAPEAFGGTEWQMLQQPAEEPLELQEDATTSFLIPYVENRNPGVEPAPPVFQCGLREEGGVSPLPEEMLDDQQTMAVGMDRAAIEPRGDTNGDGVVGIPDYNVMASQFGKPNVDNAP